MMTNQQMQDMCNQEADNEEERQERSMRLEEEHEDCRKQQQIQQRLMTVMLVMMSGRNMPPPRAIPLVNGTNVPNPLENNDAVNETEVGKTDDR